MAASLREQVWAMLRALGVDAVFGNPGSTELTMLAGFPPDLRYYLGLQEAAVVLMADGYAQVTRRPVLVNLHTGPGLGNAVGSLLTAAWSRAPLVVTAGQQVRAMITQQNWLVNVDATTVPRPAVKWSFEPPRPQDVPAALARAVHTAQAAPSGPVFVSLPMDDWSTAADQSEVDDLAARVVRHRAAPATEALAEVVRAVDGASRPALVLGAAATAEGDWGNAHRLAERAGLEVFTAPSSGRNVFDETSPWFRGFLPFGASQIGERLAGYDVVLVVGAPAFTCYPYSPGRFVSPGAKLFQLTDDPDEAARAPLGTSVIGDPGRALAELAGRVAERKRTPPEPRPVRPVTAAGATGRPTSDSVYAHLAGVITPQVRVAQESPSNLAEFHDRVRLSTPDSFLTTPSGGLGYGLAAGVGAAIADPSRPVLAIIGDGSLHYSSSALWTAAQAGAPIVTVVMANREYAILKAFAGFNHVQGAVPGLDLPGLDAVSLAQGYGVPGRRVEDPATLAALVKDALAARKPALFEIPTDPAVPPLL